MNIDRRSVSSSSSPGELILCVILVGIMCTQVVFDMHMVEQAIVPYDGSRYLYVFNRSPAMNAI